MLRLAQAPGLLLLDNLETPWDAEREKVEDVLVAVHRVSALALLASIRGNEPPAGLRWSRQRTMHPLEPPHDRDLFLDIAQDIRRDDPHLAPLLTELAGVPLAIELVAMQAAPGDTLAAIHAEWQRVGTALAQRRGVASSRLTSLELSFASPRLGDPGRRLFRTARADDRLKSMSRLELKRAEALGRHSRFRRRRESSNRRPRVYSPDRAYWFPACALRHAHIFWASFETPASRGSSG